MREQNQSLNERFTIQRFSQKGPFYLQPQQKVASLQNKLTFYQGQLDPLHSENSIIKQNHVNLSRLVSISTQILRNLLPVGNSPAKKLKLEMATIDEIAKMIEQDWKDMEQTIAFLLAEKKQLEAEINDWKDKLRQERERREREVKQLQEKMLQLKNQYQLQLHNLQEKVTKTKTEFEQFRQKAQEEQALRDKLIQSCNRELALQRYQSACKYNDYERCITRLNAQMDSNLQEFEDAKKLIKQICEKMTLDKLNEQAEGYEILIKMKEEEKSLLQLTINELTEESNQKIKQRDQQIKALNLRNESRAADIKRLQDEIFSKKQELMKQIKTNKEMQVEILRITEKNQMLSEKIAKQQLTIKQQKKEMQAKIEEYERDIMLIKAKGSEAVEQLLREKMELQKKVDQREGQLIAIKSSLQTVEKQWKERIEAAKKEWYEKQSSYTAQMVKNLKKLEEEKERARRIKQQKEKELENAAREHLQIMKRLQKQFQQNKEAYIREQTIKIRKMMDQNQEQIARIKYNHQNQIEIERLKISQQMKKQALEFQQRIASSERQFQMECRKYEEKLKKIQTQEQLLIKQLARAKQEALEHESQMQKLRIEQIKAIKKLEQQNQLNNKKWEGRMQQQMQSFLKELELKDHKIMNLQERFNQQRQEFQKKLSSKDAELVSMKEHMQREINSLKESNGTMELENKHKAELSALERQLNNKLIQIQQNYKRKIKKLQSQHEREIKQLMENNDEKTADMHNSFQRVLVSLGTQFVQKSTFFNESYIFQQTQKKLEASDQEEKLTFIREKMEETLKGLLARDNQIANLSNQLQIYQKRMEQELMRRRRQLQIEKSNLINECNRKISKKDQECSQRVETVERERKAFFEEMSKEFKQMKHSYSIKFKNLQKKYKQLQQLFSERPSRAEDVSRIKQLISIQTKLDQQITIYHKKMETANEIVKYLNLQLENYKETYDMFGPDPNLHNKTISFYQEPHKMIDLYKIREQEKGKEHRHVIPIDKRNIQSPDIKQLRVFTEKEEHTQSLIMEPKEILGRSRKYSLVPDKLPPPRDRLKTEKLVDRQHELMGHAETFMKLIKKTSQDASIIRQLQGAEDVKKKTYRRRKVKKLATGVAEHYF